MKSTWKRNLIVYPLGLLTIAGMVVGTQLYVTRTKAQNQENKASAIEQTQAEAAAKLPKVKVVEIMPIPFVDVLVLPGSVSAYEDVDLASKLSGVIEWIGPKEGQRVKKGDKLLQVGVKSEKTRVSEAQARYEQALKDYERAKSLHKDNIVSKSQLESAKTQLDTSKASLDAASVTVDEGTLLSPASGVLDQLNVDIGEYINPGQTIMKIVDIDRVFIELPVPEKDILYFSKGQKVNIETSTTGLAKCDNVKESEGESHCWFSGVIDYISMTADSSTRTYLVKLLVENPDTMLRPGMIVRAHLVRRDLQEAIAVPFFTLLDREKSKAVFVVEDGVARSREVQYGSFEKGLVEITNGLKFGEKLILVGQRGLVDGQKVEVTQDVTMLAKQWILQGKDLSDLPLDLLNQQ